MPCPHCKITIIKRSNNESAVSAAAYQSGEKLFSEYDQEQKYYPYKNEVTHKEILLPPHAPPEFADRNTLWNSAEAQEKQWNSQLARRFVLAIPREIPPEQHADLIRDYCREFFVSKGMIADFAIHDKGDGKAKVLSSMIAYQNMGHGKKTVGIAKENAYTMKVLYRLGYHWPTTSRAYVGKLVAALDGLGFFKEQERDK